MYDLCAEIAQMHPFELLDFASMTIGEVGSAQAHFRSSLFRSGYFETSLLYKAMGWLIDREPPDSLMDPDTPAWLFGVGDGCIRAARSKAGITHTTYLIELKLASGPVASAHIDIDNHSNQIVHYGLVAKPISQLVRHLRASEASTKAAFRSTPPRTATDALRKARLAFDTPANNNVSQASLRTEPTESHNPLLNNPWPHNRALLDFILDEFTVA